MYRPLIIDNIKTIYAKIVNRWALSISMKAIAIHRDQSKKLVSKSTSKRWISVDQDDEKYLDIIQKILERRYKQQ